LTYFTKTNARKTMVSIWALSLILLSVRIIIGLVGLEDKISFLSILSIENYQNALFGGLPLILTGTIIAEYKLFEKSFHWYQYILLVGVGYVLFIFNIQFFGIVTSLAIVTLCLSYERLFKMNTLVIRELSKYVFFVHLIFVF